MDRHGLRPRHDAQRALEQFRLKKPLTRVMETKSASQGRTEAALGNMVATHQVRSELAPA